MRVSPGQIVRVTFRDHAINADSLPVCEAIGRYISRTADSITLYSWHDAIDTPADLPRLLKSASSEVESISIGIALIDCVELLDTINLAPAPDLEFT